LIEVGPALSGILPSLTTGRNDLAQSSNHIRSRRLLRQSAASFATALSAALFAGDAMALVLTPFRYEYQAQRHCPGDTVVWLDFKKGKYYLGGQKLYGRGFHGSYVCLQEARRSLYRRSLLGRR
jgi:hypothetical protein